jgi:hypothetical protein
MKTTKRQLKQIIKEEIANVRESLSILDDLDADDKEIELARKRLKLKAFEEKLSDLQAKETAAADKKIYKIAMSIAKEMEPTDPGSVKEIDYLWGEYKDTADISEIIGAVTAWVEESLGLNMDEEDPEDLEKGHGIRLPQDSPSPEELTRMADDKDADKRRKAALNPNATPEILRKLAAEENSRILTAVAQHPNTPSDILEKLADNENAFIRRRIAQNRNTPPEILAKLADDEDYYVKAHANANPNYNGQVAEGKKAIISKSMLKKIIREELVKVVRAW